MKKILISSVLGVVALTMTSCGGGISSNVNLKSDVDSAAYAVGLANGQMFASSLKNLPGDSLDVKLIIAGLYDALSHKGGKMTADDANTFLQTYFVNAEKKVSENNKKEADDFLAKNKSEKDVVTTESGLQYRIDSLGTGDKATSAADTVVVNYKGTTLDGKVFDSSYERNEPATFPLDRVISGWTEAFQLFPAGSKVTLWIPGNLAYGERGPREIGPNRLLRFDCELLEVKHAAEKK